MLPVGRISVYDELIFNNFNNNDNVLSSSDSEDDLAPELQASVKAMREALNNPLPRELRELIDLTESAAVEEEEEKDLSIRMANISDIIAHISKFNLGFSLAVVAMVPRNEADNTIRHIFARTVGAIGLAIATPLAAIDAVVRLALGVVAKLFDSEYGDDQIGKGFVGLVMVGTLPIVFIKNVYQSQICLDDFADFICCKIEPN